MEKIRENLKNPIVIGVAGLIIGLFLGIMYAWVINPVEWTDASVQQLRADLQDDYLRMAIESYNFTHDVEKAKSRFAELGVNADEVLANIEKSPNPQGVAAVTAFMTAIGSAPSEVGVTTPEAGEVAGTDKTKPNTTILILACLVTILAASAVVAYFLIRQRKGGEKVETPSSQALEISSQTEQTDFEALGEQPPLSQFMTTFMHGDDLFDDSFSIDSPSGEFLGECGVGISEVIGVGEPKKVSAFEVWLFDKNDIQTVTKVLMSEHSFTDESQRQRLEAKGEPIQAKSGTEMVLETATLKLVARVVDINYGGGALPPNSFFDRLTLELAVWSKV
ncbi:MAG: hypothetical protein J7L73_04680 [Anaerolineales bacterium]|nr:hypothetical protein [Anaerolineales bacterium]